MKRTLLLMATLTLAVFVVGGIAWARTFTCTSANCIGTSEVDMITGADREQFFDALGGNDTVKGMGLRDELHGRTGDDTLIGDGQEDATRDERDDISGEGGQDFLEGEGGDNRYFGHPGADTIDAAYSGTDAADGEIIRGGPGNDTIYAEDGLRDIVACGPGSEDRVVNHDEQVDPISGEPVDPISGECEIVNP
jgi:Ca2+-binding RTX toxin-like protein